jgi:hypothetical protein
VTDTTAKIKAKGCQSTGITEELAIKLHDQLDKKVIAIVELKSSSRTEKADGKQIVDLEILSVEPATETIAEDHLREFQRALYYNRAVDEAQPTLDDGPEPTVKDVLGRGASLLEHDDDSGEVIGLWDGNDDQDDENIDEPHAFVGDDTRPDGSRDSCVRCGRFRSEDGYAHTDDEPVPA